MNKHDRARFAAVARAKDASLPDEVRAELRACERAIIELQRANREQRDRLDAMIAEANWREADARADARA